MTENTWNERASGGLMACKSKRAFSMAKLQLALAWRRRGLCRVGPAVRHHADHARPAAIGPAAAHCEDGAAG